MSDLLARALEDVERGRRTTAEVLADVGERAEELASLLAVAERIRSAEHPRPTAEFQTAAKARLLAKIAAGPGAERKENGRLNGHANGHVNGHANGDGDHLTVDDGTAVMAVGPGANGRLVPFSWLTRVQRQRARGRGRLFWARALPKVVAASLVTALLGGGTVAVSADSLPGDVLYPAKIAAEQVYLATTRDEAERARLHIEFADRRLTELEKKVERGDAPSAAPMAARYSDEVQAAATAIAHFATTSTGPNTQEKVTQLSTKLLEETTVRARQLEQVAERAPAVKPKLEEARATAAQAAAVAATPRAQPEGAQQPVAAAVAQPRAAPTQGVPAGYPAPGTPPPTAQPTSAPTAAAAAPTVAPTHPEGTRPQPPPPSAAPKPVAEAALAPPALPPPPTPPTAAPRELTGPPAGYPSEGPGTRPKDGWGYPAPGTRLEGALATTEAQAGEIAAGVRTGTTPALEDMVRGYTEALERMPDAFAADVAADRSRNQVAAALAGRLRVQYETLVKAAEQASPAEQPKLRQLLATISESMRGVLDDVGAAAPASLQPAPLPTQGTPGTLAPQPAASATPRSPADPPPAPTKAATPLSPTAVASPLAEGTGAPASPTVVATAQVPPTAAPSPNPSAVATSGPAESATPVGSPAAAPTALATGQPASPTPTAGAPPGITPTAPVTTPSVAPTAPTAAPTSPTAGPSTPTVQPQPSPTAVRTPSGALTPMRIGSLTAAATPQPAGSPATPAPTATPKK
jgi:hypothetical protein